MYNDNISQTENNCNSHVFIQTNGVAFLVSVHVMFHTSQKQLKHFCVSTHFDFVEATGGI